MTGPNPLQPAGGHGAGAEAGRADDLRGAARAEATSAPGGGRTALVLALLLGLLPALALAAWWLGSVRLALQQGADPVRSADELLQAAALVRGLLLALLLPRAAVWIGRRGAALAGVVFLAPCWPLLSLGWAASTRSAAGVLGAEAALVVGALGLALLGAALAGGGRSGAAGGRPGAAAGRVDRAGRADAAALLLGLVLAAAWWVAGGRLPG